MLVNYNTEIKYRNTAIIYSNLIFTKKLIMSTDTKSVFTKSIGKKKKVVAPVAAFPANQKKAPAKERGKRKSTFDSENIVKAIHQEKAQTQRITVDMPKDIYRTMKVYLAHENVSIRDFVVRLVDVYLTKNNVR